MSSQTKQPRRTRLIQLELHPIKCAIIAHYRIENFKQNEFGQRAITDRKEQQKIFAVDRTGDARTLAKNLIERSHKMMPATQLETLVELITRLQKRKRTTEWQEEERPASRAGVQEESASIERIEEYVELLYEGISDKVRGTRLFLKLVRNPVHLEVVLRHEAAMSALSRVLVEDGKRSMELATNLLSIFYCVSIFKEFLPVLSRLKIGDATLKTIHREIERYQLWSEELRESKEKSHSQQGWIDADIKKTASIFKRQDQLFYLCFGLLLHLASDLNIERKMVKRGIIPLISDVFEIQLERSKVLQSDATDLLTLPPQPALIQVCLHLLTKLSMFRDNKDSFMSIGETLMEQLIGFLQGSSTSSGPLLPGILGLLSNLAHHVDFCQVVVNNQKGLLPLLTQLVQEVQSPEIRDKTLRLLYLFSKDDRAKSIFTYTDIIPCMMRMILEYEGSRLPLDMAAFVCNLACNGRNVEIICGEPASDDDQPLGLKLLMQRALATQDPLLWKILRVMANTDNIAIKMAFLPYIDDMGQFLLKVSAALDGKNAIQRPPSRAARRPPSAKPQTASSAAEIMVSMDPLQQDIILYVALLGIFGALAIPDFDFVKLASNYRLVDLVRQQLAKSLTTAKYPRPAAPGSDSTTLAPPETVREDDDILLECIVILATFASDPEFAESLLQDGQHIASGKSPSVILPMLVELLLSKQDDDEIILQTLYALYHFLLVPSTRRFLLEQCPQMVSYWMDLAGDEHPEIRKLSDICLDLVVEAEEAEGHLQHAEQIRTERFRKHNAEWLRLVGVQEGLEGVRPRKIESSRLAYDQEEVWKRSSAEEKRLLKEQVGRVRYDWDPESLEEEEEQEEGKDEDFFVESSLLTRTKESLKT